MTRLGHSFYILLVHKKKERRKTSWEKTSPQNMDMNKIEKNCFQSFFTMYSPIPSSDFIWLKIILWKWYGEYVCNFSKDGKYHRAMLWSCARTRMYYIWISICLVLFLCIGLFEILIALRLSQNMTMGVLSLISNSECVPSNHTH